MCKLFLKFVLASFLSIASASNGWASGCDHMAEGQPYVDRIDVIREHDEDIDDFFVGCVLASGERCLLQVFNWLDTGFIYRKEYNEGTYNYNGEVSAASEYMELRTAKDAGLLTAKVIYENVYGSFDDNCGGPYPALESGRYHLQLTHKVTKKVWDFYYLHWLQPNNMLPLFEK